MKKMSEVPEPERDADGSLADGSLSAVFAGWSKWHGTDPFEDMAGPFFYRHTHEHGIVTAFKVEDRHMNAGNAIHGGMLMTFADYSLFVIAMDQLGDAGGVTIALNGEFTAAGRASGIVTARGEVVRATGSMVFVRGTIHQDDAVLVSFSGIVRKLRKGVA